MTYTHLEPNYDNDPVQYTGGTTAMVLAVSLVILVTQTGTYLGICTNGMTEILLNGKVAILISPTMYVRQLTVVAGLIDVRHVQHIYRCIYIYICI